MKKFLITMSPICAILLISMWISWGLKGMLVFVGAVPFYIVSAFGFTKWVQFVDKHIKD